jgi:chromate transporter
VNLALLYAEFFKIGVFSVGGGLATLPFLFHLAEKYSWLTAENIGNYLAIAQSSPGAIGVNMASQTGFAAYGIPGAILAAFGLVSPAIVIIIIVSRVLAAFRENKTVAAIFQGLRPAACGLLAAAGFGVWKLVLWTGAASGIPASESPAALLNYIRWRELAIFIIIFALIRKCRWHPIVYIILGGAVGAAMGL